MALQCFRWIQNLLDSLVHRGENRFECLPDCIIIDILSRLPADCLVKCQRVCRVWKTLISTEHFATLHLTRTRSIIIMMYSTLVSENMLDLFMFDDNKENIRLRKIHLRPGLMIRKHYTQLRFSCEGFLLFNRTDGRQSTFFVFNPITQEEVTVHTYPYNDHSHGRLCAFYFHPSSTRGREFKLLYAGLRDVDGRCQYSIYSSRTHTWRNITCSPAFNLLPCHGPNAIVNGALHFIADEDPDPRNKDVPPCANGIMVFKIDKEEFSSMPHPGRECTSMRTHNWRAHQTMNLLVKDERLFFCHVFPYENVLDIWMLEDYEMRAWVKSYRVNLIFDQKMFPFSLPFGDYNTRAMVESYFWCIRPWNFVDGELLLYWFSRGLFLCNLDSNTVRRVAEPPPERSGVKRRLLGDATTCRPSIKSLLASGY